MRIIKTCIILLLTPLWIPFALAQDTAPAADPGIDATINAIVAPVSNFVAGIIFYSVPVAVPRFR
jgi:hypothetical protein